MPPISFDPPADGHDPSPQLDARRFSLELGVLAAVAMVVEWALAGRAGGHDLHPHPYWLFVLPLAAARGTSAGVLSATVAAVFYLGRHPSVAEGLQPSGLLGALREPALFYAVAYCVGLARDVLVRENRALKNRLGETESALMRLRAEREPGPDEPPPRPSSRFHPPADTAVERAGSEDLFQLAVKLTEERCGMPASILNVREDGSMELAAYSAGEDPGDRFTAIGASRLVRRAKRQGIGLAAEPGQSDGLVACVAPLFDESGFLRAMLCLESPMHVDGETARSFFGIAEWASAGFARVRRGGELLDRSVAGQILTFPRQWLGSCDDLDERLHTEFERFVRHDVPISAIAIQATRWTDTTQQGREELDRYVLDTVGVGLRVTDTLYNFDWPGCYVLVLMGTSATASEGVLTRLQSKIAEASSEAIGPLEFHVASPGVETPDCNDLIERIADWFREASPLPLGSRAQVLSGGTRRVGDSKACLARLELELHAALRTGGEVSILELSVEHPESGDPDALMREFEPVLQTSLRRSDGAYSLGANHLLLVLPHTGAEEGELVADRIADRVASMAAPFGKVHASNHVLDTAISPDAVLEGLARDAGLTQVA